MTNDEWRMTKETRRKLRRAQEIAVFADPDQPAHRLDPPVGFGQELRLRRAAGVGRLGQHFHDLQHRIRQPCAEDEALVLGKAIHPVQNPFHVVMPLRQGDRQVGRGQAVLAQKISPSYGGTSRCSRAQ